MFIPPREVGIDISTLEAVQSLFGKETDPWALDCLANWIDVTVNHERTLYGLPKLLDQTSLTHILPDIAKRAYDRGLLLPAVGQLSADEIALTPEYVKRLYQDFETWARVYWQDLKRWLTFTSSVLRIVHGRVIDEGELNRWIRDHFWQYRPKGWLTESPSTHQISNVELQFSFDMVVRAVQYQIAFGKDRAYQPHPIRAFYAPSQIVGSTQNTYVSWGWLLIKEIELDNSTWDMAKLLDVVSNLQGRLQQDNATTSAMANDDLSKRQGKLNSVAAKLGIDILPRSVDLWIEALGHGIAVSIEIAGELYKIPCLGIGWELVSIPLKSGVHVALQNCNFIQRHVALPATRGYRPSVQSIQAKLR